MRVVFFGTPSFSAIVLQYLLENGIDVCAVISKPDKPKGRSAELIPTAVKVVAQSQIPPIPIFQPELVSSLEFADVLKPYDVDLFVVVAYGEIIKQHLLDLPKKGCINLHTSLLPKYRGAAPIQRAVIDGEHETGVSIIHMVKKMDAGDVIEMVKVPIEENDTFGDVEKKLLEAGSKVLLEVINQFERGDVTATAQNHEAVTFAPKIELEDCEINWSQPAQTIHNLVRGVNPYPGAWCRVSVKEQSKLLKVYTTIVLKGISGKPGEIISSDNTGVVVACGQDALKILELQLEGKKRMAPSELLRGTSVEFNHG
jgi:methionyl-tRNA formyltransferase